MGISMSQNHLHLAALIIGNVSSCSKILYDQDFKTVVAEAPAYETYIRNIVPDLWNLYCNVMDAAKPHAARPDWQIFILTLVCGKYDHPNWLVSDFIAFCKNHCHPSFYDFV